MQNVGPLLYHHLGQSPFTAFSDVPDTLQLGIPIHNYILYEPLHVTMKHKATLQVL